MAAKLGLQAHRKAFDATGKLAVSCHLTGEEARAVMEFMEAEEIDNPGAAGRVLITAALAGYPEWAATIQMRRAVVTEQRMWMKERLGELLKDLQAEADIHFEKENAEREQRLVEIASQRFLVGEDP